MIVKSKKIFEELKEQWGSKIIARDKVAEFTGGVITPKYIANLDSQGEGPEGRIRIGRKVVYSVDKFIEWMEKRTKELV